MTDLTIFEDDGDLYVDSRLIAERLGIEHRSFLETLDSYESQIQQAFGVLRFQTAKPPGAKGGRPLRFVFLNEDQATFVMTLSRNSPEVVRCKVDLVQSFAKAKKLLTSQRRDTVNQVPYWYQRIRLAFSDTDLPLQTGYFCAYEQMMTFFSQLEARLGYVVPDFNPTDGKYLIPDISIGQGFNKFLRSEDEIAVQVRKDLLGSVSIVDFRQPGQRKDGWFDGGKDFKEVQLYNHVYPTASHGKFQVQVANSYPTKYLSIFQYYLQEYWIPDSCIPYLQKRDSPGVKYLQSAINELPLSAREALSKTLIGKLAKSLPKAK